MKKRLFRKSRFPRAGMVVLCIGFVSFCGLIAAMSILNGNALESETPSSSSLTPTTTSSSLPSQTTTQTDAPSSTASNSSAIEHSTGTHTTTKAPQEAPADYFDDALFIGNSRTEGLMLYADLGEAQFLAHKGLMVDTVFTKKVIKSGSEKVTVAEALKRGHYGKVYVMLGMNELGWAYDTIFIQKYGEVVDAIREAQPNAVIYLQSILPVTKKKSDGDSIYNNSKIESYNRLIQQLAKEKNVQYLNVAEAVMEDGVLPEKGSTDGVHLIPAYCKKWADYLKTHTVQ